MRDEGPVADPTKAPGPGACLLGLGAMGGPMADVLHAAGVPLTVWNRTAERARRFEGTPVRVASTPAQAAGPLVLTVLPDLADVRVVLDGPDGLLAGWAAAGVPDPVLVVMGTVSPVGVARLAEELRPHGVRLVDAPVSGGVAGAREARLSIMAGGEEDDVEAARPVLEVLGTAVRRLGPVGSGSLAKACNQVIVAATVTAVSESMLMARRAGLDIGALLELLQNGLAGSEVLRQKAAHWVAEDFTPGGTAAYQLKDLRFVGDIAEDLGLVLPVSSVLRDLFASLVAHGEGGLDHTAVYRTLQRLSGLPVATPAATEGDRRLPGAARPTDT